MISKYILIGLVMLYLGVHIQNRNQGNDNFTFWFTFIMAFSGLIMSVVSACILMHRYLP